MVLITSLLTLDEYFHSPAPMLNHATASHELTCPNIQIRYDNSIRIKPIRSNTNLLYGIPKRLSTRNLLCLS